MPPRYTYWTIIADGLPTAFRAAERDELLPTFARIKHKHPDAEMKWFARGRLWDSPESARSANRPPSGPSDRPRPATPSRGREWRPGGEHRDPRQKYRDAKTARNVEERKRKFDRRQRMESKSTPGFTRAKPDRPSGPRVARDPRGFQKKFFPRNQGTNEPAKPPRPAGPSREPRPREGNEPTPPPRPSEPVIPPPGPPERGRRDGRRDPRRDTGKRRPR